MHRLIIFMAAMAMTSLSAEDSKEKPNPFLSLERLYGKPEFSAKGYSVKWLGAGQGYARLEKSKATRTRGILCGWIRQPGRARFWLRRRL